MKPKSKLFFVLLIITLNVFYMSISEAQQEEKTSPTLERGIGEYKHESYDEALPLLKKARDENPGSTLAAYYLGLTYKQLQNYKDAIPCLKDAVTFSPEIKGALVELIDCCYQTGQLEDAKLWIQQAEEDGITPAQVSFLKGLVFVKAGDGEGAIAAFKNAKELDKSMIQACDYQTGIAYLKEKKFDRAQKAFKEVVIADPSTNMANFANQYMDALEKRAIAARPLKMSVGFAVQYDSNVVLQPDDATLVGDITDESDARYVYTARGEYEKKFNDNFGVKLQDSFYYGKENRLGFYTTLTNVVTVQPNFYHEKSLLGFPVSYTYSNVDDRSYLSSPSAGVVYNRVINANNMAQLSLNYQYQDYCWSPSTEDENRDGSDVAGGLGWYVFFMKNRGFLNLRYALDKDFTRGNNWEYVGNRGTATALIPVGEKINLSVTGDVYHEGF
ncbi:MAG: tetratricopeptide repeat protein, partial [Candidatus Omnitrophica bacterium]|nr:tetratricopeptide repeat protein [Candidatus Omnitrophota bacterium]